MGPIVSFLSTVHPVGAVIEQHALNMSFKYNLLSVPALAYVNDPIIRAILLCLNTPKIKKKERKKAKH